MMSAARRRSPASSPNLAREPPPLARIEGIERPPATRRTPGFHIMRAGVRPAPRSRRTPRPVRRAHEVFDPQSRRYRYRFANCTRCGPRLSSSRRSPTTAETTMARFALRRVRGGVLRSGGSAVPCRADRLSGMRASRGLLPAGPATRSPTLLHAARTDRGGEGAGRLPACMRRHEAGAVAQLREAKHARPSRSH